MSDRYSIDDCVPHSGSMSLLDEIISHDAESLLASVRISERSMFATPSGVPAWIGIEYMAQCIAAYSGALAQAQGERVRIGLLLGTRRYLCNYAYFPLGAVLRVHAQLDVALDNGLSVFACRINATFTEHCDAPRTICTAGDPHFIEATASVNVFHPDNIDDF